MLSPRLFRSLCSCRGISLFWPSCTCLIFPFSATGQSSHIQESGSNKRLSSFCSFQRTREPGTQAKKTGAGIPQVRGSWLHSRSVTTIHHRWDFTPRFPLAGVFLHFAFLIKEKSTINSDRSGPQRDGGSSISKKSKWPLNTQWYSISLVLKTTWCSLPDLHRCDSIPARGWVSGTRTPLAWCGVQNNLLNCLLSFDPTILLLVTSPTDEVSHLG